MYHHFFELLFWRFFRQSAQRQGGDCGQNRGGALVGSTRALANATMGNHNAYADAQSRTARILMPPI